MVRGAKVKRGYKSEGVELINIVCYKKAGGLSL